MEAFLQQKAVSIIVPVKNESPNIHKLLYRIHQSLSPFAIPYEVIVIDDNSIDTTVELIHAVENYYPVRVYPKVGRPGKAYSILEGLYYATYENIVMIDADLQYPPEAIPEMLERLTFDGIVVANRVNYGESKLRHFISKSFSTMFGKWLHGLDVDVQSGLKAFKKEIGYFIEPAKVTPWTLDLNLLNIAKNMGYSIGSVDITFDKREYGVSKVNVFKTSYEIGMNALKSKFNQQKIFELPATEKYTMAHAGTIHKKKRLITHTTLPVKNSALITFTKAQKFLALLIFLTIIAGFIVSPLNAAITLLGIITLIYFSDVLFNLYIVLKSLQSPPEIFGSKESVDSLDDSLLPIYTILCPLYREANILPQFLESISMLDWPKEKLEVLLLLEEDDQETISAASTMHLPEYVKIVVVPNSEPKTKPKACNYGLNFATGEYLVIYDAEDIPDADQLKKAYIGFKTTPPEVVCLQAKLNYFNPYQNLLTRFFTAEYSLWFDVVLPGIQTVNTSLPLGGTSNHFKTRVLRELEGWDPFNVTEDCDLGMRIFKHGYKTAMIDSTTLEEANSNYKNWLRQRSRWIKGYMQTYLVHMRNPFTFMREFGFHILFFQLIIGARISFMLINPFLWIMTISYFTLFAFVGNTIEALFPSIIFYLAVFSLIFGNFLYIYNYMIGCAKRGHWGLVKYVFLIPIYWLMASIAACIALYQLLVKPHYWEKTIHGLHLKQAVKSEVIEEAMSEVAINENEKEEDWYDLPSASYAGL